MAKKCSTCNRSYPDHLPACPHCSAAEGKPPAEDALVIDDIDLVADAAAPPPHKHPAPPPVPAAAADEILEVGPEDESLEVTAVDQSVDALLAGSVPEPAQTHEGDHILEVAPEAAVSPTDSGTLAVEEVAEVAESPSGVVVVGEGAEVIESPSGVVVVDEVADVTESPSGVVVVDEPAGVAESPSGVVVMGEGVEVVDSPSGVVVVGEGDVLSDSMAEEQADSAVKLDEVAEVPEPPFELSAAVAPEAEAPQENAAEEEPPPPQAKAPPPMAPTPPVPPKRRAVQPTMISRRAPAPTMLATDEPAELPPEELGGPGEAPAAAGPQAPMAPVPPKRRAVPATMISSRAPAPTMLSPTDEPAEIPPGEPGAKAEDGGADAVDVVEEEALDAAPASDARTEPAEPVEVVDEEDLVDAIEALEATGEKGEDVSALDLLGGEVVVEGASEVDLGKQPGKGDRPSGVDMIAEALESGVDLHGKAPKRSGQDVDLDETLATGPESSAVDLGASHPDFGDEEAVEVAEEAVEVSDEDAVDKALAEGETFADDDLVVPKRKARGEPDDDDLLAAAAAEEAEEDLAVSTKKGKSRSKSAVAVADDEDEPRSRRRRRRDDDEEPRRQGGGFPRFIFTLLFGILLAAGGLAAVWYFAPTVLESIPESPNQPGAQWRVGDTKDRDALKEIRVAIAADPKADPKQVAKAVRDLVGGNQAVAGDHQKAMKSLKAAQEALTAIAKAVKGDKDDFDKLPRTVAKVAAEREEGDELLQAITQALGEKDRLKLDDYKATIARLNAAKAAVDELAKLLEVDRKEVVKTAQEAVEARKDIAGKLKAVNSTLTDAGVKEAGAKGVKELVTERDDLAGQKKALSGALTGVLEELAKGNFVPAGDDPKKQAVAAARAARLKAESPLASGLGQMFSSLSGLGGGAAKLLQHSFDSTGTKAQLAAAKVRAFLQDTPDQRVDTAIALYRDRARRDPADVDRAKKYLDWANLPDAKIGQEGKAKALYALGLAQRNNGQFADAEQSFKQAVAAAASLPKAPSWLSSVARTLEEQSDSGAWYLPHARQLWQEGRHKAALAEVDTGLKAIPGDPRLHLERARLRLDLARANKSGKLDAGTYEKVEQDARAARKYPRFAAEGSYLLGRLAEEVGDLPRAELSYREALKANEAQKGSEEEASVYRTALARLLLRERPVGTPPVTPPAKGKGVDTGRLEDRGPLAPRTDLAFSESDREQLAALLVMAITAVQPPDDEDDNPEQTARLKEAVNLATELIKSAEPKAQGEGYMILGEVYVKQGKRSEGILSYVKGLELYYPGRKTSELVKMVFDHPAFQDPDAMPRQDPLLAERHFGTGLDYYWARNYKRAEAEFKKAVEFYTQDARYQYYLGLARYQQGRGKREAAAFAFTAGARLEARSRPHTVQVNASLERVQGDVRQVLNGYRQKTAAGGP